ncbi:MAG: hypothetical protein CME36_19630 [unclassified Hahellaceae]|nr:hypothetical protein [Hahellaceae bacterium]
MNRPRLEIRLCRLLTVIGLILLVYAALVLASDWLPVDFWMSLSQLFSGQDRDAYYKIVEVGGRERYEVTALVLGFSLIVLAIMCRARVRT